MNTIKSFIDICKECAGKPADAWFDKKFISTDHGVYTCVRSEMSRKFYAALAKVREDRLELEVLEALRAAGLFEEFEDEIV